MSGAGNHERKSRLKTFRFSESLARSLEKEAADEGTSVNALASSIISEHFDWHKKTREFGSAEIPKSLLKNLLRVVDDKELARIGREDVPAVWREMAEFWSQDSSPDGILRFLMMRSRFNPDSQTRVTQEEGACTLVLRHDYGPKWSLILKSALQELVRQSFHVEPRISAGESVVTARFKVKGPTLGGKRIQEADPST